VEPFGTSALRASYDVLPDMNGGVLGHSRPRRPLRHRPRGSSRVPDRAEYGHLVLLGPASPGYVCTPSQMPAALVAPLYITDPFEVSLAAGALGQEVVGNGLATAVEGHFGAAGPGGGSPRSPSPLWSLALQ
jgi:hypothetical protein